MNTETFVHEERLLVWYICITEDEYMRVYRLHKMNVAIAITLIEKQTHLR